MKLIALLLIAVFPSVGAKWGGGFRLGGSRRTSYGGSRYSGSRGSSRRPAGRYVTNGGRTYFSGTRYVAASSRVTYRPVYTPYYYPSFFYMSMYGRRYHSHHRRHNSREPVSSLKEYSIYTNLAEHCGRSYGVNKNERYYIFGQTDKTAVNGSQGAALPTSSLPSCYFKLVGPEFTQLHLTFESPLNCSFWPPGCSVQVVEYTQQDESKKNALFYWNTASPTGACPDKMVSELDALEVRVESCAPSAVNNNFNFMMVVDNSSKRLAPTWLSLILALLFTKCSYTGF